MRYHSALAQLREQEQTCRESTGGQAARYRIAIANHAAIRVAVDAMELLAEVAEPMAVDDELMDDEVLIWLPADLWTRIRAAVKP